MHIDNKKSLRTGNLPVSLSSPVQPPYAHPDRDHQSSDGALSSPGVSSVERMQQCPSSKAASHSFSHPIT